MRTSTLQRPISKHQRGPNHNPRGIAPAPRRRVTTLRIPGRLDLDRIFQAALTPAARQVLAGMELEDRVACEANLLRAVRFSPSLAALRSLQIEGDGQVSCQLPIAWRDE